MSWDDEQWRERSDNTWTAGCRWLQSRWREVELGEDPGPRRPGDADRLVASMLPLDADPAANFLSAAAAAAADGLLSREQGSGIVEGDRLRRNLLSSQPACVNLFGPFVAEPSGLLRWVQAIDADAVDVHEVRLEWAPPRDEHFGGGSAFDAFVEYSSATGRRFLGIETKYAENLAASHITVRDPYRHYTVHSGHWLDGAERRLDTPTLRQFWLNTLLVQSLAERGAGDVAYESGTGVVVACAADTAAGLATHRVRGELVDPDRWLRWTPYDAVLAGLPTAGWVDDFRRRYLDFGPVSHLLGDDDPRLAAPAVTLEGVSDLLAIGERVLAPSGVIAQINDGFNNGLLDDANTYELETLDRSAAAIAADLKALRQSVAELWSSIDDEAPA